MRAHLDHIFGAADGAALSHRVNIEIRRADREIFVPRDYKRYIRVSYDSTSCTTRAVYRRDRPCRRRSRRHQLEQRDECQKMVKSARLCPRLRLVERAARHVYVHVHRKRRTRAHFRARRRRIPMVLQRLSRVHMARANAAVVEHIAEA